MATANADDDCGCVGDARCDTCRSQKPKPRQRISPFARKVYALARRVPAGSVTTYGELSRVLVALGEDGAGGGGNPAAYSRAVGSALSHNPFAPNVPCHRVIRADLSIGGFSGSTSQDSPNVHKKVRLLSEEGVRFAASQPAAKGKGKEDCRLRLQNSDSALFRFASEASRAPLTDEELTDEALSAAASVPRLSQQQQQQQRQQQQHHPPQR